MNRDICDIFYGEIHLPSEHHVYMPYINLPALTGMLVLRISLMKYMYNNIMIMRAIYNIYSCPMKSC